MDWNWEFDTIWQGITVLYYIFVGVLGFRLLLQNRNPVKTTAYLVALILLPVVGLVVFFFFGQDYRKDKLFSRKEFDDNAFISDWTNKLLFRFQDQDELVRSHLDENIKVARLLINNERSVLTINNKAELIKNGECLFPKLESVIRSATHHIHIEYYIIEDGEVTNTLFPILKQKAAEGVEVRVLYDDVGSLKLSSKSIHLLRDSGIEVAAFMPVRFPRLTSKMNFRDHRKIVVVDGNKGFIGGINLADRYDNRINGSYWRDTHLYVEGSAVKSLQLLFFLNWKFAANHVIEPNETYFPTVEKQAEILPIQFAGSGPDSDWSSIMQSFFSAITEGDEEVLITTPYFIPSESILTAITTAAQSGVNVKLIVPRYADSRLAHYATRSYFKTLLKSNVEIYLYRKGFVHAKTMVIDRKFCTVGTANMDYRSFYTNFEVNAFVYSPQFAEQMAHDFETDLNHSNRLSMEVWRKRPFYNRIFESVARLFSPLL